MLEWLILPALILIVVLIIGSLAATWIRSPALGSWPFARTNKQKRQT